MKWRKILQPNIVFTIQKSLFSPSKTYSLEDQKLIYRMIPKQSRDVKGYISLGMKTQAKQQQLKGSLTKVCSDKRILDILQQRFLLSVVPFPLEFIHKCSPLLYFDMGYQLWVWLAFFNFLFLPFLSTIVRLGSRIDLDNLLENFQTCYSPG